MVSYIDCNRFGIWYITRLLWYEMKYEPFLFQCIYLDVVDSRNRNAANHTSLKLMLLFPTRFPCVSPLSIALECDPVEIVSYWNLSRLSFIYCVTKLFYATPHWPNTIYNVDNNGVHVVERYLVWIPYVIVYSDCPTPTTPLYSFDARSRRIAYELR